MMYLTPEVGDVETGKPEADAVVVGAEVVVGS